MKTYISFIFAVLMVGGIAYAQDTVTDVEEPTADPMIAEESAPSIYDSESDEPPPDPIPDAAGISRIAVLRGLDKITARVRDVEFPVGVPVMFESFEITVQACSKRPPEETPETTAFVQITEHHYDGSLERVFSGWMFASTPGLNPVEHPVYDVWLIDCRTL